MNKFKKRFIYVVEAGIPELGGMMPPNSSPDAIQGAATANLNAPPDINLTNNDSLAKSLQATDQAGQQAAINDPFGDVIEKIPVYQEYATQISNLVKAMLEDIEGYAGAPETAEVWNGLNKDLRQILSTVGYLSGKINGLPSALKVKKQAMIKQKAKQ